ncbi:hypothetical protein LguiA_003139 [Lonicera macranthoides]
MGINTTYRKELEEFNEYDEKAKSLPSATQDADKLVLYGLCKQATNGPVPKERFNWDAWKAVEGKSKETAMGDYITEVKLLMEE